MRAILTLISILALSPPLLFADLIDGITARTRGDYETAIREFKSLAATGNEKAIFYLGTSYKDLLRKTYKRQSDSKAVAQSAIAALEPFASQGNSEAQYQLAGIYEFARDETQSFNWFLKAGIQDHGLAQWKLGNIYQQGEDSLKSFRRGPDYYEARKWFEKSANNGEGLGMVSLARLYATGRGVAKNYSTAIKWLEAAIREGVPGGLVALGSLYELGKGVPKDQKKADELYATAVTRGEFLAILLAKNRAAAAKGDAQAEYNLGFTWLGSSDLVEDVDEAVRLMKSAAEQLHTTAITTLGEMSNKGWKVPQDYVEAHKWYNIAASLGDDKAKYERDKLTKKMTPSQLADAQILAREWMAARKKR